MTRSLTRLPKAHLHAHLDGSYPVEAVRELAARRGVDFSHSTEFMNVWEFFDAYGTVPALVETHEDLASLCRALVRSEAANGVWYFEPAIEPQLYSPRLGGFTQVTATILAALAEAATDASIAVGALLTINTDEDLEIAEPLARVAAQYAGKGVTALGTAGFVEPGSLGRFKTSAQIARAAGIPIVSHAGQTGGPASIEEALDELGATRISHGFRAIESPQLIERLVNEQIVCDICPVSNVKLGVVTELAAHPAPLLIEAGVAVTLNADDELWFDSSIVDQYTIAREVWGLDDASISTIAQNGTLAQGMTDSTKQSFLVELDRWLQHEGDLP